MKNPLVIVLLLAILGIIIPATDSPAAVTAGEPSNSPPFTIEKWRMQEISFTSSYITQLFTGIQSTFEDPAIPAGWTAFGGGTISSSTAVAHSGSYSLKLAGRTQSWHSPQYNIYTIVKANGAGKYAISFWVYADSISSTSSSGRIVIRGNTVGQYSFFSPAQDFGLVSGAISTPVKTWTKYSGSVTITEADIANAGGAMNLMIDSLPEATGQNLYFDDIQISKAYYASPFDDVTMDVIFTGPNNTAMVMPAFWDGNNTWKVRFAPTQIGIWNYITSCSNASDSGLNNQTGTLQCVPYTGNLAIFQKGFVKTMPNTRYFVYDDGTPFFYLGDTHWSMPQEPYDEMFRSLVDDRVSKGFTVYQSQPQGAGYNLASGLTDVNLAGFKNLDDRFAFIANAGLVHANAELFFTPDIIGAAYSTKYLQNLARYWVARYAAYPVLWTIAQEADRDFYGRFGSETNPWKVVFNAVKQYDPYHHPKTAHQENTGVTKASNSTFKDLPEYGWFGLQWAPKKDGQLDFNTAKDYWNYSGTRPAVNYEGHYENLWTNEFGARMQGWTAYLNGMYGHGYGAQDIWFYNSTYDESVDSNIFGITITKEMKSVTWQTSRNFNTPTQLGVHMRNFFARMNWWLLIPRFDDIDWFENRGSFYSLASIDNDAYVVYFYNTTANTGALKKLENAPYTAKWYNPVTGVYTNIGSIMPSGGQWAIPDKPDANDWVLYVSKDPLTGRLSNLSILTNVTLNDRSFTMGVVIGGGGTGGSKPLLIRAVGPSLASLGVGSPLADPRLEVYSGQSLVDSNDNWGGATALTAAFASVGAFPLSAPTSKDAAIFNAAMPSGNYTVQVNGVGDVTGAVVAELYDATPASTFTTTTPRLINVSVLKQINAGEMLTAGFVVGGTGARRVLVRAVGPTLGAAPFNVDGAMSDPRIDLLSGQSVIASNNDWGGSGELAAAFAAVGAFPFVSATSRDAALLVTLPPGGYTAQVSGVAGASGRALVEVYEVP